MAASIDPAGVRRILFMRLSAIGDVTNTLPALSALRSACPRAWIAFLVEDKARALVEGHPDVDEVIVFEKTRLRRDLRVPWRWPAAARDLWRHARRIRAGRFDLLLDLQANLKGGLHALVSGVPRRVGFARGHVKEGNHLFSNLRVTPPRERMRRAEKFLALLAPLGADADAPTWKLPPAPASARAVEDFLRSSGIRGGEFALLHPGTSLFGEHKRWPAVRFAELARRLRSELDLPVLVAFGPGERPLAEEVVRLSDARLALETRSLLDLVELLRRARVFVGADSGPLHLASATGTPSVALFGPKDPAVYGPFNPRSRVVRAGEDMAALEVEPVLAAARELLIWHNPALAP